MLSTQCTLYQYLFFGRTSIKYINNKMMSSVMKSKVSFVLM